MWVVIFPLRDGPDSILYAVIECVMCCEIVVEVKWYRRRDKIWIEQWGAEKSADPTAEKSRPSSSPLWLLMWWSVCCNMWLTVSGASLYLSPCLSLCLLYSVHCKHGASHCGPAVKDSVSSLTPMQYAVDRLVCLAMCSDAATNKVHRTMLSVLL